MDFDLLESNSTYIFVHENQKIYHFSLDACSASMWLRSYIETPHKRFSIKTNLLGRNVKRDRPEVDLLVRVRARDHKEDSFKDDNFSDNSIAVCLTWSLGASRSEPAQPEDDRPLILLHHLQQQQQQQQQQYQNLDADAEGEREGWDDEEEREKR